MTEQPGDIPRGLSIGDPIYISSKKSYGDAVGMEYVLLRKMFGLQNIQWQLRSQNLIEQDGKKIDRLEIMITKDSSIREIYFDVSELTKV